jgi:ABC transporter substrate binding protein
VAFSVPPKRLRNVIAAPCLRSSLRCRNCYAGGRGTISRKAGWRTTSHSPLRDKLRGRSVHSFRRVTFALRLAALISGSRTARRGGLQPRTSARRPQGLSDVGYVEGKTIVFELRRSEGRGERWPELAAELVRLKVDVIVTQGRPTTFAAKQATTTIPIVMVGTGDPLTTGLVASLARPGGDVTGSTQLGAGPRRNDWRF